MRIDPDTCDDPALLAAEVRRLRAVIAAADLRLTDAERQAVEWAAYAAAQWYEHTASDTLRGLLARTSTDA